MNPAEFLPTEPGLETTLAGILENVLLIRQIGMDDNFFELGVSSLQFIQMQGRLRETLAVHVPVLQFFACPTVRALARFICEEQRSNNLEPRMNTPALR